MSDEIEEIFSTVTADGKSGSLGLDKNGKIYWNKRELITKQKVSLQWWVNISLIIGATSTLILAIVAVLQLLGCYQK